MKFKIFRAFVRKEIYHILRDPRTLFILIGLPIAQVLIFGFAVTNEFKDASIAVVDQAKDPLSSELISHLTASGHLKLVDDLASLNDIEKTFAKSKAKMCVVIPPDFSQRFYDDGQATIQLIADGTEPNYATSLVGYATSMILDFQTEKTGVTAMPFRINIENRMIYNPSLKSVYFFVPGVITLILMLISAMMTSLTLAREKEQGTMELLLVSPLSPPLMIIGKVTPYVFLSLLNAVLILAVGVWVFGVPILGNIVLLLALCSLFVVTSLALGILISTKAKTQQTAMLASLIVLLMPTMILSGFIFPVESLPGILQVISSAIPATYFIDILKHVMLKGSGWSFIWFQTLVLCGMTLFFLLVSWRNFKIRL